MAYFLLPRGKQQSKMDLIKDDLRNLLPAMSFPMLNQLREHLIEHFGVKTSPLAPAYRRYKSKFWEELSFWALPKKVQEEISEQGLILSPLFGLIKLEDPLPVYEVSWRDYYELKTLKAFWKEHLSSLWERTVFGEVLYDFSSHDERGIVDTDCARKVIRFVYIRKGKKVINSLPHRAYTLRYIVEKDLPWEDLGKINFLDYEVKEIKEEDKQVTVILESEGKYI